MLDKLVGRLVADRPLVDKSPDSPLDKPLDDMRLDEMLLEIPFNVALDMFELLRWPLLFNPLFNPLFSPLLSPPFKTFPFSALPFRPPEQLLIGS